MELYEANRILRTVKAAISADGYKLPSSAETDGLLMLLGKLDANKYLAGKIKHARGADRSSAAFERSYKLIMFFRALQAVTKGLPNPVTAMSVTMLHKTLLGDTDDNAGKLRTTDATTDGNAHTDPKYISGSVKSMIAKMNEIGSAPATAKEDFAGYISHYMRELIILRPFERNNEFTARIFMIMFCKTKGFALCYYRSTPSAVKSAEQQAFATDDVAPLYTVFTDCLSYDHKSQSQTPQQSQPRTRREVAKDLCRPSRTPSAQTAPPPQKDQNTEKRSKSGSDDEVIKRAIRLQQKISKLNEQLTELIKPLKNKDAE